MVVVIVLVLLLLQSSLLLLLLLLLFSLAFISLVREGGSVLINRLTVGNII